MREERRGEERRGEERRGEDRTLKRPNIYSFINQYAVGKMNKTKRKQISLGEKVLSPTKMSKVFVLIRADSGADVL